MPGPLLTQFVTAIGAALRLSDGTRVLDAGAACGHNLAVLQEKHRGRLRAMGHADLLRTHQRTPSTSCPSLMSEWAPIFLPSSGLAR